MRQTSTTIRAILCAIFAASAAFAQTTDAPSFHQVEPIRQLTGLALAEQSAELATTVSQRMHEVHVDEGQSVKKGQLLATLEYHISKAEYEAAKAIADDQSSVNVALVDARESRDRFLRFQQALQNGAGNQMELEIAQNEFTKSMAVLKREKSRLVSAVKAAETAKAKQESYFIRAPFDGIVAEQHVHVGNMVQSGQVIFTIVAPARLRAELNLPVELFGRMQQGETYQIEAGLPVKETLAAKLKFVSPAIDPASQTFRCVFEIANEDLGLPVGFPVQLTQTQFDGILKTPSEQRFSMNK